MMPEPEKPFDTVTGREKVKLPEKRTCNRPEPEVAELLIVKVPAVPETVLLLKGIVRLPLLGLPTMALSAVSEIGLANVCAVVCDARKSVPHQWQRGDS